MSEYQPQCGPPDRDDDGDPLDPLDPDAVFTCWCGARGRFEELFADDIDETCGGLGSLNCYCGGDICACHNHGEVPCDGCEDCDPDGKGCDDEYDYEPDNEYGGEG